MLRPTPHVVRRATRGDSLCPANSARGVDSARTGEGRRTPPPSLDKTRPAEPDPAKTRPAARTLEGWYSRKYAYCTIYRK